MKWEVKNLYKWYIKQFHKKIEIIGGIIMADENTKLKIMELREMMKVPTEDILSDQLKGLPQPPLERNFGGKKTISLTKNFEDVVKNNDFLNLINSRTSKRKYNEEPLNQYELAFLLWSTQGIKSIVGKERKATFRTVPSAGARHPFETYLFINKVIGLQPGLYHYMAVEHQLEYLGPIENQAERVSEAFGGQNFFANAPVGFVWSVIPYRTEWRYSNNAQKYALVDVGHVCQNLYLACEAIECGACAIGAYEQPLADKLLGFGTSPSADKETEFVVYAAAVGKVDR
jgi:SagB-type dehydrogenase family enzyme